MTDLLQKKSMKIREAKVIDIPKLHLIRASVKENILKSKISETDYINFLTKNGKGWVCEVESKIVGFAIVDINKNNIWALFVNPKFQGKGIGKKLHKKMLEWYFSKFKTPLTLTTNPNTRAEKFYRKLGWQEKSTENNGEILFRMKFENWNSKRNRLERIFIK